jgi:16S rRNA (adenine1518-N6/adenine1519-N6)-dimethyltransferase
MFNIPALLKQHGLRPDKAMGQNFLIDEHHLERIVSAAGVTASDEVLEVGPGLGSLTRLLAATARRVVAVELDSALFPILRESVREFPNVEIVHGDIMQVELGKHLHADGFLVVANIPYYLTSNLIRHLLEGQLRPARLVLTVQKEVAERACANPPSMSLLALSVQVYGKPRLAHHIPAGAFYPAPKVDSSVLVIDLYPVPLLPEDKLDGFFRLAKAAFQQKRKTLANSLASMPNVTKTEAQTRLAAAGIDAFRRPQTLTLEEWGRLLKTDTQ